jgi:hypothetical protein
MQAFDEAGIYVFLNVDTFDTMIVQTSPSWTLQSFAAFTAVIDAFDKYDNVAGFYISNEVFPERISLKHRGSIPLRGLLRHLISKLLFEIQKPT